MAARQALVRLTGVEKRFSNGTLALSGVDLAVRPREFVSLLGPSGCGKSTALRLIAGLGSISAGSLDWPTSRIAPDGTPEDDIGFVFQEPTLLPWRTVAGNVILPLKLKGLRRTEAEPLVAAALERVGLANFANAYPRQLSGGMKMRVSIARALVTSPKLMLMDEPFAALDEITRQRLNDDLLNLWAGHNWTVVFVTHSVYESVYLSTRIVVMAARPGRIVADIEVPAPYPRDETFRRDPLYLETCAAVSAALAAHGEIRHVH